MMLYPLYGLQGVYWGVKMWLQIINQEEYGKSLGLC